MTNTYGTRRSSSGLPPIPSPARGPLTVVLPGGGVVELSDVDVDGRPQRTSRSVAAADAHRQTEFGRPRHQRHLNRRVQDVESRDGRYRDTTTRYLTGIRVQDVAELPGK